MADKIIAFIQMLIYIVIIGIFLWIGYSIFSWGIQRSEDHRAFMDRKAESEQKHADDQLFQTFIKSGQAERVCYGIRAKKPVCVMALKCIEEGKGIRQCPSAIQIQKRVNEGLYPFNKNFNMDELLKASKRIGVR